MATGTKLKAVEKAKAEVARQNVHRRVPDIGNSQDGKTTSSGGSSNSTKQPRAKEDQRGAYQSSGMGQAMSAHADKLHPTK